MNVKNISRTELLEFYGKMSSKLVAMERVENLEDLAAVQKDLIKMIDIYKGKLEWQTRTLEILSALKVDTEKYGYNTLSHVKITITDDAETLKYKDLFVDHNGSLLGYLLKDYSGEGVEMVPKIIASSKAYLEFLVTCDRIEAQLMEQEGEVKE